MKLELKEGNIIAYAETLNESVKLMELGQRYPKKTTTNYLGSDDEPRKAPTPRKRYTLTKQCPICGKGFKGNQGLGLHLYKTHNMTIAEAEKFAEERAAKEAFASGKYVPLASIAKINLD